MVTYRLPNRAFLRLTGSDAARYLNGQITQKVSEANTGKTLWTAVTNAKGGIEGVGCIRGLSDSSFLFDCPAEIGDEMEARLDKYLIADDCEWSREDEQWQILLGEDLKGQKTSSNRYREWTEEAVVNNEESFPDLSPEKELLWRAQNAVPEWGREIKKGMLPAECGLYDLALSFDKGCYIGQEIISRMEAAGKTRTNLYQVKSEETLNLEGFSTFYEGPNSMIGLMVAKKNPMEGYLNAEVIKF